MAVAFDAVGPTAPAPHGTSTSTLSWTHTNAAGSATVLSGCSFDLASDSGVTMTCKVDGVLMSPVGRQESDAQTAGFAQAWSATGLASGARTILVTASSAAADLEGGSVSFTGATSVGTGVTNSGTSITASAVVTGTAASSMVFGFVACGNTIASTTSPATSRWVDNFQTSGGFATGNDAGATSAGGGSVTMAWGLTASTDPWAAIAVEVQAAGGPAPAGSPAAWAPGWHPGRGLPGLPGGVPFLALPVGSAPAAVTAADVPLTEAGTGTEVLAVTSTVPLTDAGTGTDALGVAIPVALTDTGASAETLALTQAASLADAGASTETLTAVVATAIALADAGSGTDTLTVVVATAVALADAGTSAEALAVTSTVPLTDAGTGTDALALGTVPVSVTDLGAAADTVALAMLVALADAGAGTDTFTGPPPALQNAVSTATVTAQDTSLATVAGAVHGGSVAAQATSGATVTDPRDGTTAVTAAATSTSSVTGG